MILGERKRKKVKRKNREKKELFNKEEIDRLGERERKKARRKEKKRVKVSVSIEVTFI